ncbi:MAG: hypothetical protein WAN36_11740 [Calditrichia bacterium]
MIKYLLICTVLIMSLGIFACDSDTEREGEAEEAAAQQGNLPGGTVVYQAPDGWMKEQPSSSMRRAEYRLPGQEGKEDATLAVFFFPGTGGSVQANLDRWYNQFNQPDGSPTREHVDQQKMEVNGLPVTVVQVNGTFLQGRSMMPNASEEEKENYAMWAAIVETANGPWFFKAVGPQETIEYWQPQFKEFVQTFAVHP